MATERKSTTGKVTDPLLNLVPRHPIQGFGTSAPWALRDRPSDVQVDGYTMVLAAVVRPRGDCSFAVENERMDLFEQTQVAVVAVLAGEEDVAPVSAHGVGVPLWCGGLKAYICAVVIMCSGLVLNSPAVMKRFCLPFGGRRRSKAFK